MKINKRYGINKQCKIKNLQDLVNQFENQYLNNPDWDNKIISPSMLNAYLTENNHHNVIVNGDYVTFLRTGSKSEQRDYLKIKSIQNKIRMRLLKGLAFNNENIWKILKVEYFMDYNESYVTARGLKLLDKKLNIDSNKKVIINIENDTKNTPIRIKAIQDNDKRFN